LEALEERIDKIYELEMLQKKDDEILESINQMELTMLRDNNIGSQLDETLELMLTQLELTILRDGNSLDESGKIDADNSSPDASSTLSAANN
jgi:hypothetical protein